MPEVLEWVPLNSGATTCVAHEKVSLGAADEEEFNRCYRAVLDDLEKGTNKGDSWKKLFHTARERRSFEGGE